MSFFKVRSPPMTPSRWSDSQTRSIGSGCSTLDNLPAIIGRRRTRSPCGDSRTREQRARSSNEWKDRIRRQGHLRRGDGEPIPAPQAGDGLLVCALVLAGGTGR